MSGQRLTPTDYGTPSNWSGGLVPGGTATFTGNGASTSPTIHEVNPRSEARQLRLVSRAGRQT